MAQSSISEELREYMRDIGRKGGLKSRASVSLEDWRARGRKGGKAKGRNAKKRRASGSPALAGAIAPAAPLDGGGAIGAANLEPCPRCHCAIGDHRDETVGGRVVSRCLTHPRPDGCFSAVG